MPDNAFRCLVVTELFLPTKGGTAVWFDEVYRRLGGKDIHIVTADVPGAAEHDVRHPNSVHRISLRRHWWLKPESAAMYGKLFLASLGLALRHEFDAVHAGRVLPEGLVGWLISRIIRRPLVIYAHGEEITTWRQSAKFKVMRFAYRHAERVIANSEFTREELVRLGVSPARIALIHPGVDIQRFRPGLPVNDLRASLGMTGRQKLILSVGRLSRRKGFDHVIRSLPAILGRGVDAHYAIIGTGEDRAYLGEVATEAAVAERVHFLGHVSQEDLPRWYNACDVFAMPNREIGGDTEGFGMVFIEAAACGKPALAGVAGGTGAAVEHEVTGLRVRGESVADVGDALAKILENGELADRLGRNGRDRVITGFSWDHVAARTINLPERNWG
ncbi:MAG: glycosyltransferase family 4 protein [Pseudomonadota bacterium]